MSKTGLRILFSLIYLAGVLYLLLPSPATPNLGTDLQSDEPGDTWQHPDQKAFFTNKNRSMVLLEMQRNFSLYIKDIRIPSYRLNYRPEEVGTLVRDQLRSYYLEEIVYPLRESLFVSGWEPQNSPIYKGYLPKDRPRVIIDNIEYLSKVTIRPVRSGPIARLFVWTLCFPVLYLVYRSFKSLNHV